jgi:hypothetical protein
MTVPIFYFTAVTVSRGTTSVDGVQNFPAYFRQEFFSETQTLEGLSKTYPRCASVLSMDGAVLSR